MSNPNEDIKKIKEDKEIKEAFNKLKENLSEKHNNQTYGKDNKPVQQRKNEKTGGIMI